MPDSERTITCFVTKPKIRRFYIAATCFPSPYVLYPFLCTAADSYDLGEALEVSDDVDDAPRPSRKRTRRSSGKEAAVLENPGEENDAVVTATAQMMPAEQKGFLDEDSDCCVCYEPVPDETGLLLNCGHLFCEECITKGKPKEGDCPYKCKCAKSSRAMA